MPTYNLRRLRHLRKHKAPIDIKLENFPIPAATLIKVISRRKRKQEGLPNVKSLQMPKVEESREERAPSPFPRPEPIRNVFCCKQIVESSHIANKIKHYHKEITQFVEFAKEAYDSKAIPVVDMTWKGLETANYILQLKKGWDTEQQPIASSSKPLKGVSEGSSRQGKEGRNERKSEEGTIDWGFGRYFVLADAGSAGFVELLANDLHLPESFHNVLGICMELECGEEYHQEVVFQVDVWESAARCKRYFRKADRI